MQTLMLLATYNLQMDWSKPSDEAKTEETQGGDNLENLSVSDAVSRHFEESLRRMALVQNNQQSNGFHQLNHPRAFAPYVRPNHVTNDAHPLPPAIDPTLGDDTIQDPWSQTRTTHTEAQPLPPPAPTQSHLSTYDTENISQILRTCPQSGVQTVAAIKEEIKEEPPDETSINNREVASSQKIQLSNVMGSDVIKKKIKQESPPLVLASTDVDIEAQLPCTSIQQRPTDVKKPRKVGRPRNNGSTHAPKPKQPRKQPTNRASKKQTNYREHSSDDDEITTSIKPRNKCVFQPIKAEPETPIKRETDTTPIKVEPGTTIKVENAIPIKVEPGLPASNIKPEENGTSIKVEEPSEEMKNNELIKTEIKTENSGTQGKIKQESGKKPRRVRNPAAIAASAKNKNRLHPLNRKEQMMINRLIESKQPFLQNLPCLKLSSRISKCRECRCASLRSDSMFCRFYDFRRLRFKDKAVLVVDGFSDPHKDPGPNDINLWMPGPPPKDIDLNVCRFILMHVGDQFCRIWQEEQQAINEHMSANKTIAWKKVVKGVREICDVCETTLFNFHWTCSRCGFGVCIDCYRDRKRKQTKKLERPTKGFDDYGWLVCTFRENHEQSTLMLTQIIPGNALNYLAHRLHEVCKLWKIPQKCGCPLSVSMQTQEFAPKFVEITDKIIKDAYLRAFSRESEIKYRHKIKGLDPKKPHEQMIISEAETALMEEAKAAGTLPVILATTLKHLKRAPLPNAFQPAAETDHLRDVVTKEFYAHQSGSSKQKYLPQKIMTARRSNSMFPSIEHDWLCNGKLLRLLDSKNSRNVLMFQEVWKRGQPVMVSELCKFLNIGLWHPEAFCRDFGEKKNDLINCMTGNLVPNQPMKNFWEGFQCVSKRLLDSQGQPMLLKLKDWPPGDDFAEILPTRFADLMSALPLPEYTLRTGTLNIASRLPSIFVPPDLGPKMYNAYGSALHPDKGTTNLHLDISDAVNIMVYVGIPTDASANAQIKAALRAIDGSGCDIMTRRRVRQPGVMPGALWHIYSARDADKIRDLLNRVTIERGYRLEPDHDPIHDQNWYLDNELRERLYDDYGVEGYPIVQCLGDAVFIPAGAPHQVRNLHNCIKVAEDFVSPENIEHCFHLSQQFRKLSMSHTNHEDKLQIRNVIYHAIKDTTSYLGYLLNRQL